MDGQMSQTPHSAFGILYNPDTGTVLLHKRDAQAPVNPGRWGLFGGAVEKGEEPLQAWLRELQEELGMAFPPSRVRRLTDYVTESGSHRFVYVLPVRLPKAAMRLGEGEDFDWFAIDEARTLDLTTSTVRDLTLFQELLRSAPSRMGGDP